MAAAVDRRRLDVAAQDALGVLQLPALNRVTFCCKGAGSGIEEGIPRTFHARLTRRCLWIRECDQNGRKF